MDTNNQPATPTRIKLPSKLPQPALKPTATTFSDPSLLKPMAATLHASIQTNQENADHGVKRRHESKTSVSNVGKTLAVKRMPTVATTRPVKAMVIHKPVQEKPGKDEALTTRFMENTKVLETKVVDNVARLTQQKLEVQEFEAQKKILELEAAEKEQRAEATRRELNNLRDELNTNRDQLSSTIRSYEDQLHSMKLSNEEELFSTKRKFQQELDHVSSKYEQEARTLRDQHVKETLHIQTENTQLRHMVQISMNERDSLQREVETLRSRVTETTSRLVNMEAEMTMVQSRLDSTSSRLRQKEMMVEELEQQLAQLKVTLGNQSANQLTMEADMVALKQQLTTAQDIIKNRDAQLNSTIGSLDEAKELIATLESKLREEETIRRKMHNTILELKGNIRVFCRVRPLLEAETKEGGLSHIRFPENEQEIELSDIVKSADGSKTQQKLYPFSYDRVFPPSSQQAQVFEEISQLVQSALDGYNVCIFAYGQTGSGKTFTMEGPPNALDHDELAGMIPRAVAQIFSTAERLKEKGWEYTMEAQFLEIYNESIRDLLSRDGGDGKKLDIKHDKGKTSVTELTVVPVSTQNQIKDLLKRASQTRATGSTNMNERSSRSHSVFTLRLFGNNSITSETSEGVLNLIDLAGSERLSSSGATGDRLKETQAINKSLSSLGDVIAALANKEAHIPYRNSKLTYLLQNSLGGNSKTLVFVNVSPQPQHFNETLNSLRFATKVNNCQIGTARKTIKI